MNYEHHTNKYKLTNPFTDVKVEIWTIRSLQKCLLCLFVCFYFQEKIIQVVISDSKN